MADLSERFLHHVRKTGSPDKARRIMRRSEAEIRDLLRDQPDLQQKIRDAVAAYRRSIVEGVIRTGTKMPHKLAWVSRNHGAPLDEVRAWAKAFPDLAPVMESLGTLHDELAAVRAQERKAKTARQRDRTQGKIGKRDQARGVSLRDLERRLAQTTDPPHEGREAMVTLAEMWKMGATTAELSVHATGCTWLGPQGFVDDRFHIHRPIPSSELVEMAKHASIDERCLCRRPLQERLFAPAPPAPPRRKARTIAPQEITITVERGNGQKALTVSGVQLAQRDPLDATVILDSWPILAGQIDMIFSST
ncbi:hypothetical protein [Nonomuraea sp. KM90]|uniref:hypothetical protein n=1 Tax=Nonomuraea sp. KM90 TaxID=3457428 RepID=UPI003FCD4AB9